jgi:AraC family transcriptional activator of pobA
MKTAVSPIIYRVQNIEITPLATAVDQPASHNNSMTRIVWVTGGAMDYQRDMHSGRVSSGQVLCALPGQVFRVDRADQVEGYWINIPDGFLEVLEHMLRLSASPGAISIDGKDGVELEDIIGKIRKETPNDDVLNRNIVRRYAEIFIMHLTRSLKDTFAVTLKTRNAELAEGFTLLLERHYKEKKMVSDYATLLAVTPNYLNEIVKKVTGQSAGYHIRQRIALEAKRHAVHSSLCMKEVAYTLGFADIAHFSKFFKNTTGRNFTDFRKERLVFSLIPAIAAA